MKKIIPTAIAAALLLNPFGCNSKISPSRYDTLLEQQATNWKSNLEDILKSSYCIREVVKDENGKHNVAGYASAVAIKKEDGYSYLTTSAHVYTASKEDKLDHHFFIVENSHDTDSSDDIPIDLVNYHPNELDTALIRVKADLHVSDKYKINDDLKLTPGDEVILVGYPLSFDNLPTKGMVSKVYDEGIVLDLTVNFGNSGGLAFYKDTRGDFYLVGQLSGCLISNPILHTCAALALVKPIDKIKKAWEVNNHD